MMREEYAEYVAECRACGFEYLTFSQWIMREYGDPDRDEPRAGNIWDAQDEVEPY